MKDSASDFLRQVRPFLGCLQAVARNYCAQQDDVADLVQETLLRAWQSFSLVQGPEHPRAWLFAIMRNIVVDWHRSSTRQISIVPALHEELTGIAVTGLDEVFARLGPLSEREFREFLDATVVRAFDALQGSFREVVVLSVAGDLSYREIAEVLDCPIGTVMSRMARARRALRERLADLAHSRRETKEVRR